LAGLASFQDFVSEVGDISQTKVQALACQGMDPMSSVTYQSKTLGCVAGCMRVRKREREALRVYFVDEWWRFEVLPENNLRHSTDKGRI
jgi:hypothetical protein